MKKNVMMRLASGLLVAVLLTTCAISGTFAKYTASNYGSDSARVAKWGVTITAATDMFYNSYKDTFTTYTAGEETAEITVQADSADTDIVAPGTNGTLAGFAVTGTPEVDVEVTYVPVLTLTNWVIDGIEYCPLQINVNGEAFKIGSGGITTVAGLKSAVEAAIVAKNAYYHTNTNLAAVTDDVVVTWQWDYEGNDDVKDSKLGDQAAAGAAASVALEITTTITQVN